MSSTEKQGGRMLPVSVYLSSGILGYRFFIPELILPHDAGVDQVLQDWEPVFHT